MEEWLTEHRARLYKKCKELKAAKMVRQFYCILSKQAPSYKLIFSVKLRYAHY